MRFLRENSLSLFFLALFLAALGGQAYSGHLAFNEEARDHGAETYSFGRYLASSHFAQAVTENWQSEYLQFALFILATVWLVQKGSNESKRLDDAGKETLKKQRLGSYARADSPLLARVGGWRTALYSNSLIIVMALLFAGSWAAQSVTGWSQFNKESAEHGEPAISWAAYVARPEFWESTLQNWQSEFLAVGTMAVFTIYLRQRGSPESKPVGAPHHETASSG
jgi:hypothetical protein